MAIDTDVLDKIIDALQGKSYKGERNTGLISAMHEDTARRLIIEAFRGENIEHVPNRF